MGEEGAIVMSSQLGERKIDVENPHLGSSNSSTNSEVSVRKRDICSMCVTIVDLVNHILIVSLTVFTLYYTVGPYVSQIHATLCTLGVRISTVTHVFVLNVHSYLCLLSYNVFSVNAKSFLLSFQPVFLTNKNDKRTDG